MPIRRRYGKKRAYTRRKRVTTTRKTRRTKSKSKLGTGPYPKSRTILRSRVPNQLRKASNRTLILRSGPTAALGVDPAAYESWIYLVSPGLVAGTIGQPGLWAGRLSWKLNDLDAENNVDLERFDYVKPMCCTWTFTFPFPSTNQHSFAGPGEFDVTTAGANGYGPIHCWWYYDWDTDGYVAPGSAGTAMANGEFANETVPSTVPPDPYQTIYNEFQRRNNVRHLILSPKRPTVKFTLSPGRILCPVLVGGTSASVNITDFQYVPGYSRTPGWMPNALGNKGIVMRGIRVMFWAQNGSAISEPFTSQIGSLTTDTKILTAQVQKEMFVAVKGKMAFTEES